MTRFFKNMSEGLMLLPRLETADSMLIVIFLDSTRTIPAWVNAAAEKHGVTYSQLLQEAILDHIGLKQGISEHHS